MEPEYFRLRELGWSSFFESQLTDAATVGRVASANHGHFLVWTETGEVDASVSGAVRKSRRCGLRSATGSFCAATTQSSIAF